MECINFGFRRRPRRCSYDDLVAELVGEGASTIKEEIF
jgi:hypothetical protein